MVVATACLSKHVLREQALPTVSCDCGNANVLGNFVLSEFLVSSYLSAPSIKGQDICITGKDKMLTKAYSAFNRQMSEGDKPAVHRSYMVMKFSYLADRDESDYLFLLDGVRKDVGEGRTMRPTMLANCCLDVSYVTLPFLRRALGATSFGTS